MPRPGTFLPFGGGERICIGNRFAMLEMKTAMAHIVRKYTWQQDPSKPMRTSHGISTGVDLTTGSHIILHPRIHPHA